MWQKIVDFIHNTNTRIYNYYASKQAHKDRMEAYAYYRANIKHYKLYMGCGGLTGAGMYVNEDTEPDGIMYGISIADAWARYSDKRPNIRYRCKYEWELTDRYNAKIAVWEVGTLFNNLYYMK